MESKQIADLLTQYDNILHEFDRLKERQKEILNELLETKLPDDNKIKDIIDHRFDVITGAMRANYPEESKYNYRHYGVARDLKILKEHKDYVKESRSREPKVVPDGKPYKEKPRWWNELTM
ncbi:MAG: hypothetical protein J1F35_08530 [Erysipelotrichales bacterium]|nr:hypothetical protein [Erysipelotrichales bacterium]